ncbi:MAG: alpha-L-fucosidase [Lentisphaeria bacterium]|nr:alpha-L-fucosidase [Lentisphaeria bacterium]
MIIPKPLPYVAEFEKLGFGLFVHWGLYSQLGIGEWSQFAKNIDVNEYRKLADSFNAEDFNAMELVGMAKNVGIKYITFTTRHHEGFSLYDTCGLNDFDAPHSPAKRDLVREFVDACNHHGIKPFFYHTTLDWSWNGKKTPELEAEEFNEYLDYLYKSVEILCRNYGEVGGFWFDGNWSRPNDDWQEDKLYSMIKSYQPNAMIINNTGLHALGAIGNKFIDSVTCEQNAAKLMNRAGMTKYLATEVCKTINNHWGKATNDFNYFSPKDIIEQLCHSRGCEANYLLNIGLEAQGKIPDYERALLGIVGHWVKLNGEAIYNVKPVANIKYQGRDFLLQNGNNYYYFAFDLKLGGSENVVADAKEDSHRIFTGLSEKINSAVWLDNGEKVQFSQNCENKHFSFDAGKFEYGTNLCVRVLKLTK